MVNFPVLRLQACVTTLSLYTCHWFSHYEPRLLTLCLLHFPPPGVWGCTPYYPLDTRCAGIGSISLATMAQLLPCTFWVLEFYWSLSFCPLTSYFSFFVMCHVSFWDTFTQKVCVTFLFAHACFPLLRLAAPLSRMAIFRVPLFSSWNLLSRVALSPLPGALSCSQSCLSIKTVFGVLDIRSQVA